MTDPAAQSPPHACGGMTKAVTDDTLPVSYHDRFREYGIDYQDGGSSFQLMLFCAFCGARLPASVRMQWFDYFWSRDLDPHEDPVPPAMRTGQWWREAGL